MNMIDTTFGVSPRVLALRSQRSALIAANLTFPYVLDAMFAGYR